jgi:hypothetical protein
MPSLDLFGNDASTTVVTGGTTTPSPGVSETWVVLDSSTFPAASNGASPPTQFRIVDPEATEVMIVTNVSGTTWTVTRGAEGTTPVAHLSGFLVFHVVSKGALSEFLQIGLGDFAGPVTAPTLAKIQGTAIGAPTNDTNAFLRADGAWSVPLGTGGVVSLVDGATITIDASTGRNFRVTIAGDRVLANPVNGVDGQLIRLEVTQGSGGSHGLSYGPAFDFGFTGPPNLSTTAGLRDVFGFSYNAVATTWDCLAFTSGY